MDPLYHRIQGGHPVSDKALSTLARSQRGQVEVSHGGTGSWQPLTTAIRRSDTMKFSGSVYLRYMHGQSSSSMGPNKSIMLL